MVLCGALGKKTLLLYLQMLGAIQLIPMLLVVAQNIIMSQFAREMIAIQNQFHVGSIAYSYKLFESAKELMGLGGMIASTIVPAIAMSLITGSGMAMMGAAETATQDRSGNFWSKSSQESVGKLTNSASIQSQTQRASQRLHATEQAHAVALNNAQKSVDSKVFSASDMQEMGSSIMQSTSDTKAYGEQLTQQIAEQYKVGEGQASKIAGAFMLQQMGLGLGLKAQEGFELGLTKEESEIFSDMQSGTHSKEMSSILQEGKTILEKDSTNLTTQNAIMDEHSRQIQDTRNEKIAAAESYQSIKSASKDLSMTGDDLTNKYHQKAHEDGTESKVNSFLGKLTPEQQLYFSAVQDEFDGGVNATNMDDKTAQLAALAATAQAFNLQSEFVQDVWAGTPPIDDKGIPSELQPINLKEPETEIKGQHKDMTNSEQALRNNQDEWKAEVDQDKFQKAKDKLQAIDIMDENQAYQVYDLLYNGPHDAGVYNAHTALANWMEEQGYSIPQPDHNMIRLSNADWRDFFENTMNEGHDIFAALGVMDQREKPVVIPITEEDQKDINARRQEELNEIPR